MAGEEDRKSFLDAVRWYVDKHGIDSVASKYGKTVSYIYQILNDPEKSVGFKLQSKMAACYGFSSIKDFIDSTKKTDLEAQMIELFGKFSNQKAVVDLLKKLLALQDVDEYEIYNIVSGVIKKVDGVTTEVRQIEYKKTGSDGTGERSSKRA